MKVKTCLFLTIVLGIFLINGLNIPFLNPASAHASSQIIIADVFTKSFSVIYNLSEPPQGSLDLWVYNSTGDQIREGITIEIDSAPANSTSPDALSNRIVKFTVKRLGENTRYFYQLRVNGNAFLPLENPSYYGQDYLVTTEKLNDPSYQIEKNIITNDSLLFPLYKTSGTSALGSSVVLVNILDGQGNRVNDRPLSAWVGSCSLPDGQYAACINLNNLYDKTLHTPLELTGGEGAEITYLNEAQAAGNREVKFMVELPLESTVDTQWGPQSIPQPRSAYFYHRDVDLDGYGREDASLFFRPIPPAGYSRENNDCNDADAQSYPGAVEKCDGKDNNCNGLIDEGVTGCTTYYKDADGDGYGVEVEKKCLCAPDVAGKYTATKAGDCNDADAQIHPGVVEQCDGRDNNCNGTVDEGIAPRSCDTACGTGTETCQNGTWSGCTGQQPVPEVCGDGKDNNCDGEIDEGCCNGDLDGKDGITPADALFAFRCYLGSGICTPCSDVNGDHENTPKDALCLFQKYLGIPSCLD